MASSKEGKKRSKIKLSKLLSYAGVRSRPKADELAKVGTPGFERVVYCNQPLKHQEKGSKFKYASNYISTTKYNFITFLPKSLFEQFRRVANLYFLFCACLALTPLSPYSAFSLIAPLVFVVGVSMIKEAWEDWKRWAADQEVNKRKVLVHVGGGTFEEKEWQSVTVGDIVKVTKDDYFPADLLLLSSNHPDGVCYVETMNLDGETNLKLRKALEATLELSEASGIDDFNATIHCEDPNPSLYTFVGNMEWGGETIVIGPQQILLRDSKLRNTQFIFGVVIFTGHESKVMKNSTEVPSKRSSLEKRMDKIIYMLFAFLVLLSVAGSVVFGIMTSEKMPSWWYLVPTDTSVYYDPSNAALSATLQCVTDIILYGYLIPISLYVSVEIVKVFQAWFISSDLQMYDPETDRPAKARTSNLNEELGQVDTILSDKTGTLTCNSMEFLKCCIGGVSYGRGITEVERASAKRLGKSLTELEDYDPNEELEKQESGSGKAKVKGFAMKDDRLLQNHWVNEPHADTIRQFMQAMAVCHTVVPEEDEVSGAVSYEAESPDEASFVEAARQMGFELCRRTQTSVFVKEPVAGDVEQREEREYKVLNVIEFNSTRKRMTVIARDSEQHIWVFCKGADSVIFERLSSEGQSLKEATRQHLQRYGEAGLRTLVWSVRQLTAQQYSEWNEDYEAARTSLSSDRDSLMDQVAEKVECELQLLGASAVEDKLQRGVSECIDRLAQAGIKIWVLTGDKVETAINIGFACSLLRDDMTQLVISLDSPEIRAVEDSGDKQQFHSVCFSSVQRQLADAAALVDSKVKGRVGAGKGQVAAAAIEDEISSVQNSSVQQGGVEESYVGTGSTFTGDDENDDANSSEAVFALIIDGKSLSFALEGPLKATLLALAMQCASVVCCRVSPKQKALVTRLVKEGAGKTTLAIGDGANDVGMIHEAHIGVGISGVEGQQAVMASDFAIAQFRFLERLLLVHGHWCYKRIAGMITYFFYKNVVFGLTIFYYNYYNIFSGQVMYNSWVAALYNVVFTSLPVIGYGVLEQDVNQKRALMFPALYQQGPRNLFFSWQAFFLWSANGLYASVVLFWLCLFAIEPQHTDPDGRLMEMSGLAGSVFTAIVITVNVQMLMFTEYLTWINHLFIFGSIAVWFLFAAVYSYLPFYWSQDFYYLFNEVLLPSGTYWLASLLLAPGAAILPYFIFKTVQMRISPLDQQLIQELVVLHVDEEAAKEAIPTLRAPVGFSATVDSVTKRIAKKDRKRRRRRRE